MDKTTFRYEVEFHRSNDRDFCAIYHYMNINDMLHDMLEGDLNFLINCPDIEFLVSAGEFPSIWESFEDE